MDNMKLSAAYS